MSTNEIISQEDPEKKTRAQSRFFSIQLVYKSTNDSCLDFNEIMISIKEKYKSVNYMEVRQNKVDIDNFYLYVQQRSSALVISTFERYLHIICDFSEIKRTNIYSTYASDSQSTIIGLYGIYYPPFNQAPRPSSKIGTIIRHNEKYKRSNAGDDELNFIKKVPTEKKVSDDLSRECGGAREIQTPVGRVDVVTEDQIIEVKYFRHWKSALGQILAYGSFHVDKQKVLHLFTGVNEEDAARDMLHTIKAICNPYNVLVTLERRVEDYDVNEMKKTLEELKVEIEDLRKKV